MHLKTSNFQKLLALLELLGHSQDDEKIVKLCDKVGVAIVCICVERGISFISTTTDMNWEWPRDEASSSL